MKSYKKRFPFVLGAPSYVLPLEEDNLVSNVRFLKDRVDMVQLLYFGRDHLDDVMSPRVIGELDKIRGESGISYTVHLPLDLDMPASHREPARASIAVIERIVHDTTPLAVEGYVLHLDAINRGRHDGGSLEDTNALLRDSLSGIARALGDASELIYIENTASDLLRFREIIHDTPFQVCMDVGHLLHRGQDIRGFVEAFRTRIAQVHLHGVSGGRDHRSLAVFDGGTLKDIMRSIQDLAVPVIVEVYNYDDMESSLRTLDVLYE